MISDFAACVDFAEGSKHPSLWNLFEKEQLTEKTFCTIILFADQPIIFFPFPFNFALFTFSHVFSLFLNVKP